MHEAIRDLVRARLAAVRALRQARQQLSGFLLRHGHHYNHTAWTLMYRRWLAGLRFDQPAHHIVLEECIAAVEAATARRNRLEAHIDAMLPDWSLAPVVRSLQALRGMAMVAAATLVAELGDITRFAKPSQAMAYLGLVPSEHSSSNTMAGRVYGNAAAFRNKLAQISPALNASCPTRPLLQLIDAFGCLCLGQGGVEVLTGFVAQRLQI